METRHDLRRRDRVPCEHSVTIMWRDLAGEDKFALAKAVDICELGMRVQMPEALTPQTYVALSASKLALLGNASVRHCERTRGSKFAVGIEFCSGLRWKPKSNPKVTPKALC